MDPVDNNVNVRAPRGESDNRTGETRRAEGAGRSATARPGDAGGEQVTLSRSATELQQLETRLRELPGVDGERVAALREAIAAGSYRVDAADIADKLLRSERDLA